MAPRVLILNQFFHPDIAATAQLATDLADDLAAQGMVVTAVATRGNYSGGARLPAEERRGAVRIRRIFSTSLGKASWPRRVADYGTFLLSALLYVLTRPVADVTVVMSTPPMVAAVAALARLLRGGRLVYWVQDVYPDLAEALGVLRRGSAAARVLEVVSRWTLRRADAVVVLGQAMADLIVEKGVPRERIFVVPNWADQALVQPVAAETNGFCREHGLAGRVVAYSGNMGRGHDLATLLAAIERLRGEPDLTFLFVGDGVRRAEVEQAARTNPAIRLLPYQPRARLSESLSAGLVHLASQDPATLGMLELSKLYGIMAVGRPVLYVGPRESEVARTVVDHGIGRVVANGDVDGVVAALRALLEEAAALGARARTAFEHRFDRTARTDAFADVLRAVAKR